MSVARFFELNRYYALPGREAEVLATRRRASDLLARLGQPVGQIHVNAAPADGGPTVIWSCTYATRAGREASLVARAASAEFEATRRHMRTLTRQFDRELYEADAPAEDAGAAS